MISNFKEFNDFVESFSASIKRLERAFVLLDVKEGKKLPGIISCMGSKL